MSADEFAAVAERVCAGARLCSVRRLTGGVSADVHALELEAPDGGRRTVVVRRHGAAEWRPGHARPAMEYRLLEFVHRHGIPVPEPILLDTSGQWLPQPYLVMAFVEGSAEVPDGAVAASLDVMAATLTRLHALAPDTLPELPSRNDPLPELYDYLPDGAEWHNLRAFLSDLRDSAYRGEPVLLHGDFWPGNLLWRDGRLVAVLDWEDAALGDPLSDVAGCRLELLWKYGASARDHFTDAYGRERPVDARRLALWEVFVGCAASRFMGTWGLEPAREADMRDKALMSVRRAAAALMSPPSS